VVSDHERCSVMKTFALSGDVFSESPFRVVATALLARPPPASSRRPGRWRRARRPRRRARSESVIRRPATRTQSRNGDS
jgi:hypothetical protein